MNEQEYSNRTDTSLLPTSPTHEIDDRQQLHVQLGSLAAVEYRIGIRSHWLLALLVLFIGFGAMLVIFSGARVGPSGVERVLSSIANLAMYLVPIAAMAYGFDAIVGRNEHGWLASLLVLPLARWRVVGGIFLGRAGILTIGVAIGFLVTGGLVQVYIGAVPWGIYAMFILATIAVALAFLAIAVAISALAPSKTYALGIVLLVWMWFILIHDLLSLGFIARFDLGERVLSGLILANPAGTYRVIALELLGAGGVGGYAAILSNLGLSRAVLFAGLIGWVLTPLAVASIVLRRRRWSR